MSRMSKVSIGGVDVVASESTIRSWIAAESNVVSLDDHRRRVSAGSYFESIRGAGYAFTGAKWSNGLSSSGRAPIIDNATMRANARSAVHDSMPARAIVERYTQMVVDTGVSVSCAPIAELLGITPEAAEEWASDVEQRFHLWASSQLVTAAEDMTLYQAQRYTMRARKRDGEWFIRLYYDSRRDLLNPLRIGFIDANQIQGDALTDTSWAHTYGDGVERDDRGREISYTVLVQDADGKATFQKIPAVSLRSGLPLMLHGYSPEYAGQGRGFSAIGHAIHEFEMLTDFTAAQIKKAIIQSSISMYVKPPASTPALNPFRDLGSGPVSSFQAPTAPSTEPGEPTVSYSSINDTNLRPGSVGVFNLQGGEDLKAFDSSAPSESFASFLQAFTGYLAQSVSMPPEVLALKFGSSFSAMRGVLILFWRTACIERDEEASDFYNPVFRAWLSGEIAAGRVSCPGWSDPRMRAAWCNCTWSGPPMISIDPSKTATADQMYVQMGAQTLDDVAKNLNGSSGAANRQKNKRQIPQLTKVPWQGGAVPGAPGAGIGGSAGSPFGAPKPGEDETDPENPEDDNDTEDGADNTGDGGDAATEE
jgi:lambda family phage portal protein